MEDLIAKLVDIGGTVTVTGLFLWYMNHRNGKSERALKSVADCLNSLQRAQETHTRVLMRVARNHGLNSEADDLMEGRSNR